VSKLYNWTGLVSQNSHDLA